MQQRWYDAQDEAIRVPLVVSWSGMATPPDGFTLSIDHVDGFPILLGLAPVGPASVVDRVVEHHVGARHPAGRNRSPRLRGELDAETLAAPAYLTTEDPWELSDLSADPEVRANHLADAEGAPTAKVRAILDPTRSGWRRAPHRNP
jgi:arylsulfatase A-like enzyme